jgi:hypothetical protein
VKKSGDGQLSRDTLERVSYILGIYKALQILLPDHDAADAWIRKPNSAPPFGGRRRSTGCFPETSRISTWSANISMPSAAAGPEAPPRTRRTAWKPAHRLIPSRFPPVGLFDRVADPKDLEALYALEALTNDRVRDETGNLQLVAAEERIAGPGTTPIMAAFTHLNPLGSRFSDGSYGVYYCAQTLDTALAEVRHHQQRFLRATNEGPLRLEMRLYLTDLDAKLADVRKIAAAHHPDDYAPSRRIGRDMRAAGRDGILYRSVRHEGGLCAAVFRPKVLGACRQAGHYAFHFDGSAIVAIDALSSVWTIRN